MKKIILAVFILSSFAAAAKHIHKEADPLKNLEGHGHIESLSAEQKERLLTIRREYFTQLKDIQTQFRELRKEANHCMMNNDEGRYEEIHDKMNELKFQREQIKDNYRKKIEKVLDN